jgi:bifunctional DNA-binding transcriptional regulator/antitoxin component of YhaV-PrlF toxin-antitoxin module
MEIRKIIKNGRGSYYVNIPKEYVKEFKWKERQKVVVTKRGKTLSIKD